MSEARFLVRLDAQNRFQPSEQPRLLTEIRTLAGGLGGEIMNLRVTRRALEFDLFTNPHRPTASYKEAWAKLGPVITWRRLDEATPPLSPAAAVAEARRLFNEERYWEVHEVLESLWHTRTGAERRNVQTLILAAAAFVHAQKNEMSVAWRMLEDVETRLRDAPHAYEGWDIESFRAQIGALLTRRKMAAPTV